MRLWSPDPDSPSHFGDAHDCHGVGNETTCIRFLEPANSSRSAKMKGPPCGSEPFTERTRLGMKNEPASIRNTLLWSPSRQSCSSGFARVNGKPMTYVPASAGGYRRHRRNCHCTQSTNEGPQCFRSRRKTLEAPAHSLSGGWEESSMPDHALPSWLRREHPEGGGVVALAANPIRMRATIACVNETGG